MYAFFITLMLFASMEVVSKPLMEQIGAIELTLYRFVLGWLFLVSLFFARGGIKELRRLNAREWFSLAILGVINTALAMSLLQLAVKHGSVSETVVIFSSNPLLVLLFGFLIGEETFSVTRLMAVLLGIAGMIVIIAPQTLSVGAGSWFALGAAFSFTFYTLGSKKILRTVSPLTMNTVSIFFGNIALILFLWLSGIHLTLLATQHLSWIMLIALLYLGVFVSGVGYITFMMAIRSMGAFSASFIFLLKPAVATLLAWLFLSETLSLRLIIGMIFIGSGLWLMVRAKRQTA